MNPSQIIQKPLITEKSNRIKEKENKFTFQVHPDANKTEIKKALEQLFKVKVVKINTVKLPGKRKRFGYHVFTRPVVKKAIATLKPGDRIELFEGA